MFATEAAAGFSELGAVVEEPDFEAGDWWPTFLRLNHYFASLREGGPPPPSREQLEGALAARQEMATAFLALFERYDVLLCPTAPRIAPTREEFTRWMQSKTYSPEYTCLTGALNLIGFPALTIPAGFVDGMPVGLQVVARPDEDAKILRVAHAFLRAFPNDTRPSEA